MQTLLFPRRAVISRIYRACEHKLRPQIYTDTNFPWYFSRQESRESTHPVTWSGWQLHIGQTKKQRCFGLLATHLTGAQSGKTEQAQKMCLYCKLRWAPRLLPAFPPNCNTTWDIRLVIGEPAGLTALFAGVVAASNLDFQEIEELSSFQKKTFKVHMGARIAPNVPRWAVIVSDNGTGLNLFCRSLTRTKWLDHIRIIYNISLKSTSDNDVQYTGKTMLHFQLSNVDVHLPFSIVDRLLVLILSGASLTNRFFHEIFPMELYIVSIQSLAVSLISK